MGSSCAPDRNASRRVPRSGFALTRYLAFHVRLRRADTCENLRGAFEGCIKAVEGQHPRRGTVHSVPFLIPHPQLTPDVDFPSEPLEWMLLQLGSKRQKTTSSPSSPSPGDRRKKASYTTPPCLGISQGTGHTSRMHRQDSQT